MKKKKGKRGMKKICDDHQQRMKPFTWEQRGREAEKTRWNCDAENSGRELKSDRGRGWEGIGRGRD
jgi:hypothetical protein